MRRIIWSAVLLAWLAAPSASSAQLAIDRVVIGSHGARMNGGTLELNYTLGEPISGLSEGETQSASLGYWWSVITNLVEVPEETPARLAFGSITPTPFRSMTTINFTIPQQTEMPVFIGVYDVRGGLVKTLHNGQAAAGNHRLVWNGQDNAGRQVGAGLYFITFRTAQFAQTRRTVMLK